MEKANDTTLILQGSDVESIIQHHGLNKIMDVLIERLQDAIASYLPDKIQIPVRSGLHYQHPHDGLIEWMPLLHTGEQAIIKVVGYHPFNPEVYQKPTILSTVSSYDVSTGHLTAVIDGVLLTAIRTGAASAVASKYLAHPQSSVLGIIGCGAQSVTQLHALARVFPIRKVLIYDIDQAAINSFASRIEPLQLDVEIVAKEANQIAEEVDILVTATTVEVGGRPLFEQLNTRSHLHINAVGSDFPGKVELPLDLLKRGFVCPDFPEQAREEGECQMLQEQEIGPSWVEVIKNYADYKHLPSMLTVFDSTGWPLEDLVLMEMFIAYARELGVGQKVALELVLEDSKSPYQFINTKNAQIKVTKSAG